MDKKRTFINRLNAVILAVVLCLEGTPGWAQIQPPLASPAKMTPAAAELKVQNFPKELGSVTEIFQSPEKHSPHVILVQDAHAVPDAQRAITKLTEYFEKNAGLAWVGLEGASRKLDPVLLANYPDKEILKEALESYVSKGEISGAVAAAILGNRRTLYEGLEDSRLYEEDVSAYLESLSARGPFEEKVKKLRGTLEALREAWYPQDVVQLERKREEFERGRGDLFDYLHALEKFRPGMPPDFSGTHPLLASLLSLTREKKQSTLRQLHLEIKALAEAVEKSIGSHVAKADFFREKQAYETEQKAPEEFLSYLLELNARSGLKAGVSALLRRRVSEYQRVQRAAGEDLNREIASAVRLVKQTELRSELDRRVDAAAQKLVLLEKVLALELHSGEWLKLLALKSEKGASSTGGAQEEQLEQMEAELEKVLAETSEPWRPWMRFYEKAVERENRMWEKLNARLQGDHAPVAMLVTGGFHREGLAQRFRKAGVSYWVVSPSVPTLPEEIAYPRHMQGDVSWKKHFQIRDGRVDVYEAFHRDIFLKLGKIFEERNGVSFNGLWMRKWRENIFRELAGQNRMHEAQRYTRHLDDWLVSNMEPARRESLSRAWEHRVKNFTAGLETLTRAKRLNPESLSALLSKPAAVGWNAVLVLSHETVPAEWLAAPAAIQAAEKTQAAAQTEESSAVTEEPQETETGASFLNGVFPALQGALFRSPVRRVLLAGPAGLVKLSPAALSFFQTRSELRVIEQAVQPDVSVEEALSKPQLAKLKIAVNLKDAGAYYRNGVLSYEDSLLKLKKLLPLLRSQGAGSIYLYGGLYDMGGISSQLHRGRPDARAQYISENNGRALVKIENYATKKTQYSVTGKTEPLVVEDGHNPFSILSLLEFNPHLSSKGNDWGTETRTHEQLRDVIRSAHELGMKVTLDFIPWIAPDAINEANFRWTFYQELADSENQRFRSLPEDGEGETKETFLRKKIDENPSYFTVRIHEPGQDERVVLVRHLVSDMGGVNVDQAVLNPFLPAVREYYRQALQRLVDAGADEVRVDLGHVYLREYIVDPARGYFSDAYWRALPSDLRMKLEESLRSINEPWEGILKEGKEHAKNQGRELSYVMEAYDESHLRKLKELGADKTYYADVFKNLVRVARGEPAHFLEASLRHAVGNRGSLVAFPSNFDQFPLRSIKGAQNAARALLLVMPELQLDVMWDLRDWMGFSGQVFPMVGGDQDPSKESDHTFADQKEFEITTNPAAFYAAVKDNETAKTLASLLAAVKTRQERYIEFLDNARRDRFTTLTWQTENGDDWLVLALNFKPEESSSAGFIELPRRALIHAGAKGFKAVDAETGELIPINEEFRLSNVSVSSEKQYRLIRLYREGAEEPLKVSVETRSELRTESSVPEIDQEGERLRRKLFHDRILDEETQALLISLIPRPLAEHAISEKTLEEIPWVNLGEAVDSPTQLVYRVSFQDPDIVVFSLSRAMPGPWGLSQDALVYLPLQDLGEGYLGLLQHGRLQGLELSAPRTEDEKTYVRNPFAYWLENNLDSAARRLAVKGALLKPLKLTQEQLAGLGFRKTRDEALWFRPTGAPAARSELRAVPVAVQASVFGRGPALTEDYKIEGDTLAESDFQGLFQKIQARIRTAGKTADAARAAAILEHLRKMQDLKKISVFQEQRWARGSYITAAAGTDSILFGEGFLSVPDLAEEALFRLAENSFDLANSQTGQARSANTLYRSEDEFRKEHQDFVELKDEAVLRAAVRSFHDFSPGKPMSDTRVLFENWVRADMSAFRKGKDNPVYPALEQAGFLAAALAARGWDRMPENPEDPEAELARDPDRAKAFFEIVYPLYVFGLYRYQFLSHVRVMQQIYLKSIRKTVEDIDGQLRDKLIKTPEVMRGGFLRTRNAGEYLEGITYNFSNDVGIEEDLITQVPMALIADYQKNMAAPAKFREKNSAAIEAIVWDLYQKTITSGKKEFRPAWHLYADMTLGNAPSPLRYKQASDHVHKLLYDILKTPRAWQEEWLDDRLDRRADIAPAQRKIPVPGRENAVAGDLGLMARSASGYLWKGLAAQLHNAASPDSDASLAFVNTDLSFRQDRVDYRTVSGTPVSPFWQSGRQMRYHIIEPSKGSAKDRLVVFRDEALFWSQVYVWTTAETGRSHSSDDELPFVLPLIGAARRNLLQQNETPAGEFNFNGVDVGSWIKSMMAIHDLAETRFWTLVGDVYPGYAEFFDEERTPWTEQKMFWYYSLMRHPKGLFAELASKVDYVPGSKRLTPESAAFVLDALYAIYWGGPQRQLPIEGNRWILGNLLHYLHIHPDGVSVPNPEGLLAFLTENLAPQETVLDEKDFTEWLQASAEKKRLFSDKDALVETVELKNPEPGSPQAQMRPVLSSANDYAFDPEYFPAENLLRPEALPWPSLNAREAVWTGIYQGGIRVPGSFFRYRFPADRVTDGTELTVRVFPPAQGESGLFEIVKETDGKEEALVRLPLPEALTERYARGLEKGQSWERVPDPVRAADGVKTGKFEEIEVRESGFLVFQHEGRQTALHLPALYGHDSEKILIQREASNIAFFTKAGDLIGHLTFGQAGPRAVSNTDRIRVLAPFPVSVEAPEFQSLSDYTNLLALASELKPLMSTGKGYDKIVVTGRREGDAGIDNRMFVLPGRMLEDVPSALGTIKALLVESDPSYRLQLLFEQLDRAYKTGAYFERGYVFQDIPELEPFGDGWTEFSYGQYKNLDAHVREKQRTMRVLSALDRFRAQHESELGPHWSRADRFRNVAGSLLQRTDTAFHFHAKGVEFNGLKGLTDMEYQHAEAARRRNHDFTPLTGLGVATADHFRIQGGELALSKNPNPDPQIYLFIRTHKEGKPVIHIFNMETGEKVEETERRHRELEAKFAEARISLSEALAMSSGKLQVLHLNRLSYDIDDFMSKISTGDEIADLEFKLELSGKLQQLLPPLIKSDYSEINTAAIAVLLREIIAEGPALALERANRFQQEFSKRADEPSFYLHALLDLYHESFSLSPENPGENYPERFYDFFDNAFLPAAQEYSSQTGFSQFVHADSYYQGVVDLLFISQRELSESINTYLDKAPEGIRRRDVLALMHGFEVQRAAQGGTRPWEPYFVRKIFREIADREKQITEEEARERATYITAYGGVEGIGASSALIEYRGKGQTETDAIITDAGIKIDNQNTPPAWPDEFPVPPKAVFLTHAHLDHVGAAIDLWEKLGREVPFYITPGTADILGKVLEFANSPARESEGPVKARDPAVVEAFMKSVKVLKLNRWYAVSPKMKVYFHGPVGHLHGAASLVISTPDSNTFLSGDVSIRAQGPVPAFAPLPPEIAAHIDQALIESTYGMIKRMLEEQQENKLVNAVAERISEGGRVLIPAFANGRAQRVLLLLLQNLDKIRNGSADFKIYIDGQAAVFTALYLKAYPEVFQPYRELIQRHVVLILSDDHQIRGRMRSEIDERDGGQRTIIISSAGNASQGRSRYWATRLANDPKSGIFFTGYMDPQEIGSQLLRAAGEGKDQFYFGPDLGFLPLLAKIAEFKLAGHASGDEIISKVLEPIGESLRQLWIGHGGAAQSREVLEWIREHRPEWNPVILRRLEHAQGSVPMTIPGLAARLEFFNSLNAELLYEDLSAPVQTQTPAETAAPDAAALTLDADLTQTAGTQLSQAPSQAVIPGVEEFLQPETADTLASPGEDALQEALVLEDAAADEPGPADSEIVLSLDKERLTKESRQILLELRLEQVPELKAAEAVIWLKQEVVRRGLEEKTGTFGESTLRGDLKDIRGRSELREFIDPVLRSLARPELKPEKNELADFAAWAGAQEADSMRRRLEDEAVKNPHYLVLMAGGSGDERNLHSRIQAEAKFAAAHPDAAEDRNRFVRGLLSEIESDARRFFETSPEGTLHYSFAFPLEGSQKVQSWFLEYAETIKKIKSAYPGRVTSDLRLLVTREESQDASRKEFFQRLARTGAKTLETSSSEGAGMLLKLFVEDGKNKNALVYGAQDLPVEGIDPGRLVRSKVNSESAFPVAVLLTRQLAQVSGHLPADLLGRLTQELPAGMLTFNGTGLEITTLAMELMYRFQADRRIQTAA